jgi:putative molybdopterin biosynthesis protein
MLPGVPAMIIRIGQRKEGFYVRRGNPKGITGGDDLKRRDITIVNREKGSGVRVLLDEKLRLMGVNGEAIPGYMNEAKTHLAVAAQVSNGAADFGIGKEQSIQNVPDVDFIPLQLECYDLIIRSADADKPQFRALIDIMTSEAFRQDIEKIAGFDVSQTGRILTD